MAWFSAPPLWSHSHDRTWNRVHAKWLGSFCGEITKEIMVIIEWVPVQVVIAKFGWVPGRAWTIAHLPDCQLSQLWEQRIVNVTDCLLNKPNQRPSKRHNYTQQNHGRKRNKIIKFMENLNIQWLSLSWNIGKDWSPIVIGCQLFWLSYNWPRLWVLPINLSSSSTWSVLKLTVLYVVCKCISVASTW